MINKPQLIFDTRSIALFCQEYYNRNSMIDSIVSPNFFVELVHLSAFDLDIAYQFIRHVFHLFEEYW